MEQCGVDIGDVVSVLDRVEPQFVGRSVDHSTLDPASGHPDREPVVVVISAVLALGTGRASELAGPDHDGFVEQSSLLQVTQQTGDRLVGLAAHAGVVADEVGMSVPGPGGSASMKHLHESHALLDQSTGGQQVLAKWTRGRVVEAVECLGLLGLTAQVHDLRNRRLHAKRQVVGLDPGP